ncbi:MAG TPA: glutathione transferase [Myxococcales bacterium]|nr:glutathione transferase [Myxococcales bacterium]
MTDEIGEPLLYCDARFTSPWVLVVWTALKEKGVPFRPVLLDLAAGEHRTPEYRSRTFTGKVPALRHRDVWISESLAILEYLEETFAPPAHPRLMPAHAAARARDRQIMSWIRSDLFELRRCLPFEGLFLPLGAFHQGPLPGPTPKALEEAAAVCDAAAGRSSGEGPTLADFELCFMFRRLVQYGVGLAGRGDLVRWSDGLWNRPSVQSWVTHARPRSTPAAVRG